MPRDSSGNYSLPGAVNPVVSGTTITSNWANTTLDDLRQAMTDSLDRNGRGGMLAPLRLLPGTVATPSLAFTAETTTGMSRPSAGQLSFSVLANEVLRITAAGVSLIPAGTALLPSLCFGGDTTTGMFRPAANVLGWSNSALETMRLSSVGLGVGISPSEKIHTNGNIWSQGGSLYLSPASLAVMGAVGSFNSDATNGGLTLSTRLAGVLTETARLTQTGTLVVGFAGAIFPAANRRTLEVNGASESLVGLARAGTGTAYLHSTPTTLRLMQVENLGLLIGTNNVDRLSISNQGNVGIAAPSSGYALTVTPLTSNGGVLVTAGAASNSALFGGSSSAGNSAFMQLAGNGNAIGITDFLIGQDSAGQANLINRANVLLKLGTNNLERLTITADGRIYGTALHNNAGAVTGTVNQYMASGTYAPTLANNSGLSAVSAPGTWNWIRVGNVVHVSGPYSATPTGVPTTCSFTATLPIASNLAATGDLSGTATQVDNTFKSSGDIIPDTVGDRALVEAYFSVAGAKLGRVTFQYTVL